MAKPNKLLLNAITANFSTPEGREAIFKYYKSKGLMSGETFKEFAEDLQTKISARKGRPKDILRKILGKDYEGIPLTITDKGQIGVDHYKYGDTIPRPLEDYLTGLYGKDEVKAFKRAYGKSWADMSTAAQDLFDKYGIRFDRGHFTANYRGGAKLFGASLERAYRNQMHGAKHRSINDEAAKNLLTTGRSSNWLEDFFQHKLASDNLDVLGAKHLTEADFEAINKGADPNQLLLERLDQVERSGVKPNTNILTAELEESGFDTLKDLDRHKDELLNRYIVETGTHPQSGQKVGSLSIQKAEAKIQPEIDQGITIKPRGKEAWLNTIQGLNKEGVAPKLEKLDPVNPGVTTSTKQTPEISTTTKPTEVVSYQKEFVPLATSTEKANIMREWLQDLDIDGRSNLNLEQRMRSASKLSSQLGRGMRTTGGIANLAAAAAYGSGKDVALAAGGLTLAEVIQNPTVQKTVGKQLADLVSERGAKSAAKLIPGLDILLSAWESGEYLSQGKLDQAGIALLSGAIGWIPVIGDGAAAALDLSNTARDISGIIEQNQPGYEPPPEPEPLDYTEYNQLTDQSSWPTHDPSTEPTSVDVKYDPHMGQHAPTISTKDRVWGLNEWLNLTQQ